MTSSGLIISVILAILIIAAIGVGYFIFNRNDDDENKQPSRLHLSPYDDSSSDELRVESAKIAGIKANIEEFLKRMENQI